MPVDLLQHLPSRQVRLLDFLLQIQSVEGKEENFTDEEGERPRARDPQNFVVAHVGLVNDD